MAGKVLDALGPSADTSVPPHDGPRWTQIANALAAAIERGDYVHGATLPAATTVAARYGVHRHTVRQAFRHLQDLGLVSVERGRGTVVTADRFPYRLGRRVSLRGNFGAQGIAVEGRLESSSIVVAEPGMAERLGVETGAHLWAIRTLNHAAGVPVSTGLHHLSVERFPDFDRRIEAHRASITAAFRTYGIEDYVRLSTRLSARLAMPHEIKLLALDGPEPVLQSLALDGLPDGTPLQDIAGAFAGHAVEMVIDLER